MGKWYAVEVVEHNRSVERNTISTVINLCPTLQLTREGNSTIRLHWNESAGELIYRFRQPRAGHPGFWDSVGAQRGKSHSYWLLVVQTALGPTKPLTNGCRQSFTPG
jgi:hypothetical protein